MTVDELYNRLKNVKLGAHSCIFTPEKCEEILPLINRINQLKKQKNAIILAHSYVSPEIVYGVADYRGDSYGLSKNALESEADIIVFAAVRFMGETAKILSPHKKVLIPGTDPGCTLADAVTAQQVRDLRAQYPEHTFICYINTTAEVKAECDICVTSSNVYNIVQACPSDKIVFLPDRLMGQNVINEMKKRGVDKQIILYDGTCYVHEEYSPDLIDYFKLEHPGIKVVSHPECKEAIVERSDFVGATGQMMDYVKASPAREFLLLTECGLGARLQVENPEKSFIGSCQLCKYMKSNSLEGILRVLEDPRPADEVVLESSVIERARICIDRMFEYAEAGHPPAPVNPCD